MAVAATKTSPTDAVTEYDTAVQRLIQQRLSERRPEDGLLGEEALDEPGRSGVVWVVDPIDGTVNFVYGLPAYAVSVAAEVDAAAVACLLPEVRDVRRVGAGSLDLCAVAAGRVDAYVEEGLQPWDLAAGRLVAEEAGAVVVGLGDRPPGPRLVLATLPGLLDPLRELVGRCGF